MTVAGECGFVGNAIVDSRDGGHFLRLYLNTGCVLRARSPKIVLQQYRHFSGETISLHLSPSIWGEADLLRTCASVMPHAASDHSPVVSSRCKCHDTVAAES